MNMSRIVSDLFSMIWLYAFVTIAWTFGMVYLRNNKFWISPQNNATINHDAINAYASEFIKVIYHLIWKLLDPGSEENDEYDGVKCNDIIGVSFSIMYFCYQAFVFLVCINLLIAVFNSSVQRLEFC